MDSFDDTALALTRFGVGQPVPRMEDPTCCAGQGRYTDDQNLPGQAHAVMVRSRIATAS
jgi:carbon-monoxide dehydrogenase large subunit